MLRNDPLTPRLERALRRAAAWHAGQARRGSGVPYVQHVVAVAWMLDRLGFSETVVVAGLLHDAVEDTEATADQIAEEFGPEVAELVVHSSEVKLDAEGRKRPWIDRKRDHLAALAEAPTEARAIGLADKLHNLLSIQVDLEEGRPVWSAFHARRDQVLWYYRAMIDVLDGGDPRLNALASRARTALAEIEGLTSGAGDQATLGER